MSSSIKPPPVSPKTPTPPSNDDHSSRQLDNADAFARTSSPTTHDLIASASTKMYTCTIAAFLADSVRRDGDGGSDDVTSPFNFRPISMAKSPVTKSIMGQRRGHKYKHSSISHQILQEPPKRAPLALPNSLPIPTLNECRISMYFDQKVRFCWSICHMSVAGYTLFSSQGSMAMSGLSHLILFDSLGAMVCVVVDVLSNFEVWKRSSIRHPFGLERAEVLAGFAMSVLLFFMGGDLVSHTVQHSLENQGGHESHQVHEHERVSPGEVDIVALLAIVSTLISAFGLKNHARIGKAMRLAYIQSLPSLLSNPAHFLTLSCSTLLLLLPLLSLKLYTWIDRLLSLSIAFSMCGLGMHLVKNLGSMLLMSYSGPNSGSGVSDVMKDIRSDPHVVDVEEAKFWQVHYGLCMANIRLQVSGSEEGLVRLRERVASTIRNRLAGGYGLGNQRWEVSLQLTRVNDR
ncbi:Endoplasmic reticulum zinc transporter [Ascosphaera aggregata]|nr:Endoplasmic reticulum zinc transporter [Ascosphaera aggregata]